MELLLDPKIDVVFKQIFAVTGNEELLISLINSIVSEDDCIDSLTIINATNLQRFVADKLSEIDIKAKCCDGRLINIEMQVGSGAHYEKRALYYWSRLYNQQLEQRGKYSTLKKTIGIHLISKFTITENTNYYSKFRLIEETTGEHKFKEIELHVVELDKFEVQYAPELKKTIDVLKTALDKWSAFLTNYTVLNEEKYKSQLHDDNINRALEKLEFMSKNPEQRSLCEDRIKQLLDIEDLIETREALSKEEGERKKQFEIAKKMLLKNRPIEEIVEFTELSADEIKEITL
jgi:predicted transposase/invertase (TIGR01784 family)